MPAPAKWSISEGLVVLTLVGGMLAMGCRSTRVEEVRKSREISGLAVFSDTQALCVHDAKADTERNDPRLGVIDSSVTGGRYRSIEVAWPDGELANDLEAICRVPGRAGEFLVAESGYRTNETGQWSRAGRLFRIQCEGDGEELSARVVQSWRWPEGTRDVEGIACAEVEGQTVLWAANRYGTIFSAHLNFAAITSVPEQGERSLRFVQTNVLGEHVLPSFRRKVGDLYLDDAKNLWAVATVDSADMNEEWNDGPFRSVIYQVGRVSTNLSEPIQFHSSVTNNFVVEGLKVEGLTGSILGRGQFTIGSDDEDLGGVWRIVGNGAAR